MVEDPRHCSIIITFGLGLLLPKFMQSYKLVSKFLFNLLSFLMVLE